METFYKLSLAMGIRPSALLKEIENEVELQKAGIKASFFDNNLTKSDPSVVFLHRGRFISSFTF